MLRSNRLSRKGSRSWENDTNPIEGVANLTDVMLVLACGLMMAIVMFWKVDLSSIKSIVDQKNLVEIENSGQIMEDGTLGESFESMGVAYEDPKTGKVYIIKP